MEKKSVDLKIKKQKKRERDGEIGKHKLNEMGVLKMK